MISFHLTYKAKLIPYMKKNIFWSVTIIIMVFVTTLPVIYQVNPSISGENLTCINSNITKLGNQSINPNIMSEEYFKNLTSDNPQLAQLICQDILNHTTKIRR